MIEKALKYINGLKNAELHPINNRIYTDKSLELVEEPVFGSTYLISSLQGIVDYVEGNLNNVVDSCGRRGIIHIRDEHTVIFSNEANYDMRTEKHIVSEAVIPSFPFGRYMDVEEFVIALQSKFLPIANINGELVELNDAEHPQLPDDRGLLLMVCGNLKEENVRNFCDDGISQGVTIKTGITSAEAVKVPNPVTLKPFRSFVEIDQPESKFVFRMRDGGQCALFEADGGAWRVEARKNIKEYFERELSLLVEQGDIVILG